ncbi:MAG TPA: O-antigen ligase family protein [Candidatus Polarisedimenticolia bacterium]|nr:O-antigen ligase family protein [Candidatus Polarisedimenticolia bacterium]
MSRLLLGCAAILLFLAPFGEGGRRPDILAALHLVALGLGLIAAISLAGSPDGGRLRGRGNGLLVLVGAALAWSCAAATAAPFREAALFGLMDRLATAALFIAGAILFHDETSLVRLRTIAVAATTLQAAIALAGTLVSGPAGGAHLFLNRSQLAAYLGIGFFLAASAALGAWRRGDRRSTAIASGAALVHILAILPLQSRGALLGLACGGLGFLAASWTALPRRARAALVAGGAVVAICGSVLVAKRFRDSDDPDRYTRVPIWRASLAMASERPLRGLGPGQFPHEAPKHNFPLERSPVRYARQFSGAHSLPLTLFAEEGWPGLLLAAAIASAILRTSLRSGRHAPGGGTPARDAILGVGAAVLALSAQGMVEDLQERPAILLTAALLAGSACAAARGWRPERCRVDPIAAGALGLLAACVAAGGVVLPWLAWREAQAARALGPVGLPRLERAAQLDPLNPWHREGLAMAALQGGPPDRQRYALAAIHLDAARRLAPREARLALLRARLEAVAARSLFPVDATIDRAASLYDQAVALSPRDPRPRLEQAGWLAEQGRRQEARATLEQALAIEPNYRRARILLTSLVEREGDYEEARRAYDALLASDAALDDYVPDSGYAAEIVRDAPEERDRVAAWFRPRSHCLDES